MTDVLALISNPDIYILKAIGVKLTMTPFVFFCFIKNPHKFNKYINYYC